MAEHTPSMTPHEEDQGPADLPPGVVSVQFSHPSDDGELESSLRAEGLTPLMICNQGIAATTEEHIQDALDAVAARMREETYEDCRAYRESLVTRMIEALALPEGEPTPDLPDDALLLLAEGLVVHGHTDADALPYCAVFLSLENLDDVHLALRPTEM